MLKLEIPDQEGFNETTEEFEILKGANLVLEHSLISISKWESKWCVPFLAKKPEKTREQVIDYIKFMTLTQNVNDDIYYRLKKQNFDDILAYINAPMTATIITQNEQSNKREIITSELIYYWMITLNIPFECQKWHLNRLLTLINICSIKQGKPKKLKGRALARSNAALNAQRRAAAMSSG